MNICRFPVIVYLRYLAKIPPSEHVSYFLSICRPLGMKLKKRIFVVLVQNEEGMYQKVGVFSVESSSGWTIFTFVGTATTQLQVPEIKP